MCVCARVLSPAKKPIAMYCTTTASSNESADLRMSVADILSSMASGTNGIPDSPVTTTVSSKSLPSRGARRRNAPKSRLGLACPTRIPNFGFFWHFAELATGVIDPRNFIFDVSRFSPKQVWRGTYGDELVDCVGCRWVLSAALCTYLCKL